MTIKRVEVMESGVFELGGYFNRATKILERCLYACYSFG